MTERRRLSSIKTILIVCVALVAIGNSLSGQVVPADPVPTHDTLTIISKAVGEARRINVHVPAEYSKSPSVKFPVLYMPDGGLDEDFPHIVHTVDSLISVGAIRPVIVVGIPNTERRRDLTPPTRIKSDSAVAPRVGQSQQFRQFINDELFPEIERRYRTTTERSIIGESFAGLFIVETFLLQPSMFTNYIALDASTWWNAGALIDGAPKLLKKFDKKKRTLYLAVSDIGEMGEGVTRLHKMLKARPPKGIHWIYVPRMDLKHDTIFRALEGPSLAKTLR